MLKIFQCHLSNWIFANTVVVLIILFKIYIFMFSDGRTVGATLDRNGLRPARYWRTSDDFVYVASEVGFSCFFLLYKTLCSTTTSSENCLLIDYKISIWNPWIGAFGLSANTSLQIYWHPSIPNRRVQMSQAKLNVTFSKYCVHLLMCRSVS
jgi:hypothetical protein